MEKIENKNDYIYIVLVKALTGLGKFSRLISNYDFSHIAICLDENLDVFHSFSRRKHYSPFDCGYMKETLDCYAFGKNKNVKLKIFKVPVSKDDKGKIKLYIKEVSNDTAYVFNFYSMITMPFIHGFKIYKAHNCMSFVSKIIQLSKSVDMLKPYYKYNIKEIDIMLSDYTYDERFFKREKIETLDYMNHVSLIKNIVLFLELNGKLIYRLIMNAKYKK